MLTVVKFLIVLITTLLISSINTYESILESIELIEVDASNNPIKDSNAEAYQILYHKCNACHRKRNKSHVFTTENMNNWANDIYKQVFIYKRMPKGKNIKLTSQEYQDLLTWISSNKTSTNGI